MQFSSQIYLFSILNTESTQTLKYSQSCSVQQHELYAESLIMHCSTANEHLGKTAIKKWAFISQENCIPLTRTDKEPSGVIQTNV